MRSLLLATVLLVAPLAHAGALPDDARIGAARVELQGLVDQAAKSGLPGDILIDKVREGLAKGVPATRILAAVRELSRSLDEAQRLVITRRAAAPDRWTSSPALLRAIAEARTGGASADHIAAVLAAASDGERGISAVTALSDLIARSFPPAAAASAVVEVITRAPATIDQLGQKALERREEGASPETALRDVARTLADGGASRGERSEGVRRDPSGELGPNRETSGQRGPAHGRGPRK